LTGTEEIFQYSAEYLFSFSAEAAHLLSSLILQDTKDVSFISPQSKKIPFFVSAYILMVVVLFANHRLDYCQSWMSILREDISGYKSDLPMEMPSSLDLFAGRAIF